MASLKGKARKKRGLIQQFCAQIVIFFPELWLLEQGEQGDKSDRSASAAASLSPSPRQKVYSPSDEQYCESQAQEADALNSDWGLKSDFLTLYVWLSQLI